MNGPMVIEYTQDGRAGRAGGIDADDLPLHLSGMEETGCTVTRIYDGIGAAREAFPLGTRVVAARKWWGAQAGTVTAPGDEFEWSGHETWSCCDIGPEVLIRWDDGKTFTWWASGLEAVARPAADSPHR